MELSLSHTLRLFNIFREYDGKENCAQVLEEQVYKMFGIKSLNDEHDCNVVSMNSLNIHDANEDCTSYDENASYKHVNFCGVDWVCKYTPNTMVDCIGALVRRRDGDTSAIWMVDKGICNLKL